MLERLGVQNEWRDKSKLAFAKLQKMLDPSYKFEFADPAAAGSETPAPPPPPAPTPPTGRGGTPEQGPTVGPRPQGPGPAGHRPRAPDSLGKSRGSTRRVGGRLARSSASRLIVA